MKILLKRTLLIGWLVIIFLLSNQNGEVSSNLSGGILALLGISDIPWLHLLIRKFAHFSEYFILYLLFGINFGYTRYSLLFCVLVAVSDEFHQLFIADRVGSLIDVLIDSSGSLMAGILMKRNE